MFPAMFTTRYLRMYLKLIRIGKQILKKCSKEPAKLSKLRNHFN